MREFAFLFFGNVKNELLKTWMEKCFFHPIISTKAIYWTLIVCNNRIGLTQKCH